MHVIDSVHTEMVRMKEEWEAAFNKPPTPPKAAKQVSVQEPSSSDSSERQDSDSYCFELLSMLLGLSQSEVGCGFLSEQDKLVHDLFTLLHVASLRIQLQVRICCFCFFFPSLPHYYLCIVFLRIIVDSKIFSNNCFLVQMLLP